MQIVQYAYVQNKQYCIIRVFQFYWMNGLYGEIGYMIHWINGMSTNVFLALLVNRSEIYYINRV